AMVERPQLIIGDESQVDHLGLGCGDGLQYGLAFAPYSPHQHQGMPGVAEGESLESMDEANVVLARMLQARDEQEIGMRRRWRWTVPGTGTESFGVDSVMDHLDLLRRNAQVRNHIFTGIFGNGNIAGIAAHEAGQHAHMKEHAERVV